MIKNLLTIVLLFFFLSAHSQLNEYYADIQKTFEKDKKEHLSKISKEIKETTKIYNSAVQNGDLSKGINEMKKASGTFKDIYRDLFFIYEQKLEKLSKEMTGENASYVDYLISEAKNSFRISIADRLSAEEEKEDKIALELFKSAHENENKAINFQSRAFGVINGWIKEDFTIPETNYNIEESYNNTTTDNFEVKYFSISNASLPENYTFNKKIENSVNSNNKTSTDVVYTDKIEETNYNNNKNVSLGSEYRIQIGTSILPANDSQLKRLNSTELNVKTYKSKTYYKYTIGSFATFQEAKNYKNAYGLSKTYIAEYKDGREIKFYIKDFQ